MRRRWPLVVAVVVGVAAMAALGAYQVLLRTQPGWLIAHAPHFAMVRQAYDADPGRDPAIEVLARVRRDPPAGTAAGLAAWLADERTPALREIVVRAMAPGAHPAYGEALLAALARETDEGVRWRIVDALMTRPDRAAALPRLPALLAAGHPDVRLAALSAIVEGHWRLRPDEALALVAPLTRDRDAHVAATAIAAVGCIARRGGAATAARAAAAIRGPMPDGVVIALVATAVDREIVGGAPGDARRVLRDLDLTPTQLALIRVVDGLAAAARWPGPPMPGLVRPSSR